MKQAFTGFLFLISLQALQAQQTAAGLRINGGTLLAAEISFQQYTDKDHRIEADLGFGGGSFFNVIKLSGIFQWVLELEFPLYGYAGIGASAGYWNYDDAFTGHRNANGVFINLAGQIGAEYRFDIPLQISIDFKPEFAIINGYSNGFDGGAGLGIRYMF